MKISRAVIVAVLVASFLLALFTDIADAAKRRNRRGRNRPRCARDGLPKHIYVSPLPCGDDSSHCTHRHCQGPGGLSGGSGGSSLTGEELEYAVKDTVSTVRDKLTELNDTLATLGGRAGAHSMSSGYPGHAIKELNPTSKLRLASDSKFKLLGQTVWWVNWIRATLTVLETLHNATTAPACSPSLVPQYTDPQTQRTFDLPSTLTLVKQLQVSLGSLWNHLGGQIPAASKGKGKGKGKSKNPLECQRVKVTPACSRSRSLSCSDERVRKDVILRDSQRAVVQMWRVWTNVQEQMTDSTSLTNMMPDYAVFYGCAQTSCDLQKPKRCRQSECLSWVSAE